jgi:hypothetical protein
MAAPGSGFAGLKTPPDANFLCINGSNPETGTYAVPPIAIDDLANTVRARHGQADSVPPRVAHGAESTPAGLVRVPFSAVFED